MIAKEISLYKITKIVFTAYCCIVLVDIAALNLKLISYGSQFDDSINTVEFSLIGLVNLIIIFIARQTKGSIQRFFCYVTLLFIMVNILQIIGVFRF